MNTIPLRYHRNNLTMIVSLPLSIHDDKHVKDYPNPAKIFSTCSSIGELKERSKTTMIRAPTVVYRQSRTRGSKEGIANPQFTIMHIHVEPKTSLFPTIVYMCVTQSTTTTFPCWKSPFSSIQENPTYNWLHKPYPTFITSYLDHGRKEPLIRRTSIEGVLH